MSAASPQRQLDEVSRVIGGVETAVANMEKYLHDFRHDENNRRQVDQNFQDRLLNQVEKLRQDIAADRIRDRAEAAAARVADRVEIDAMKRDVEALKGVNFRREGMLGAVDWFFKSPLVGWLSAAFFAAWASMTGRLHL